VRLRLRTSLRSDRCKLKSTSAHWHATRPFPFILGPARRVSLHNLPWHGKPPWWHLIRNSHRLYLHRDVVLLNDWIGWSYVLGQQASGPSSRRQQKNALSQLFCFAMPLWITQRSETVRNSLNFCVGYRACILDVSPAMGTARETRSLAFSPNMSVSFSPDRRPRMCLEHGCARTEGRFRESIGVAAKKWSSSKP
jgi:hypothetical protein